MRTMPFRALAAAVALAAVNAPVPAHAADVPKVAVEECLIEATNGSNSCTIVIKQDGWYGLSVWSYTADYAEATAECEPSHVTFFVWAEGYQSDTQWAAVQKGVCNMVLRSSGGRAEGYFGL